MAAWGHFLADVDATTLLAVIDKWVRLEPRQPSIADILDRVSAFHGTDAESAWKEVRKILTGGGFRDRTRIGGPPKPRGFSGNLPLEDAVQDAGGWLKLAGSDENGLIWAKKEFIAAYAREGVIREAYLALSGGEEELEGGSDNHSGGK